MHLHKTIRSGMSSQKLRFILAGGTSAGVYFLLLLTLLHLGIVQSLAALIAYSLAFLFGYTAQKTFAFRSETGHRTSLPRYALVQIVCAGIAAASASAAASAGIDRPLTVAIITTGMVSAVSYVLSSTWVFKS